MEIVILRNSREVGTKAASLIAQAVRRKPSSVLGLATGSSPSDTYLALGEMVRGESLDFTGAAGFALDEYVGVASSHPASYASVIRTEVTVPLKMNPARVHVPDGRASDLESASEKYEQQIVDAGGIDIQVLGIGRNGHLGFNEPTSSLSSRTRVKTLTEETRRDNARFFASPDDVPVHCITQGIGTILDARQLILVATGTGKAHAIAAAVEGPVSSFVPASALQLHQRVTIIIDETAAAQLRFADYYRHTYASKLN